MSRPVDTLLGANDVNEVRVLTLVGYGDLGGGGQLQLAQFLPLLADDETVVIFWNVDGHVGLLVGKSRETKSIGSQYQVTATGPPILMTGVS